MTRFIPLAFFGLILLCTLLRASASWSAPLCLEGTGWRRLSTIEGQFLTHINENDRPARARHKRRAKDAPTAPPKHEGLDKVELWELPNSGPLADPENRTALLIEGDGEKCDVSRLSGKGAGRMEISVVPISRETDAVQVRTTYLQGSVRETTQLYTVNSKELKFEEIWNFVTIQTDPTSGKPVESRVEYLDVNADNFTDISLTDAENKIHLWKWNNSKKRFESAK